MKISRAWPLEKGISLVASLPFVPDYDQWEPPNSGAQSRNVVGLWHQTTVPALRKQPGVE